MSERQSTTTDYQQEYNSYWSSSDRIGETSADLDAIAGHIVTSCGTRKVLDVGSGEGRLVGSLVRIGVDAIGVDVSELVVNRSNQHLPGRFFQGSVLALPFEEESFHTVVSTDCMEHLSPSDVIQALSEIFRVAKRFVFLQIATTQDRDNHWHLTVEGRAWWETRCFEAGFRKHPAYYRLNGYESLNSDRWQIYILLEKIPSAALVEYPLDSLDEERGLHMDMTRDTGERSDAHIIRYQWACNYIKPGDRVLDAACGLGYGGHVVRHLTHAAKVVGIDGSDYAIDYARKAFPCAKGRAEYRVGMLPSVLSTYPDGAFDVIISFETLEHVEEPVQLLREFYRLLTPGGRVIVSVPNDWSDETGEDPNPFHLHVYDWSRLKSELSGNFILEEAYAQTASQCKITAKDGIWERRPRSLKQVVLSEQKPDDCEWWLMTAMKSPLEGKQPYEERVFANIATSGHPSIRYSEFFDNPWLMYAMVNYSYRLKNAAALELLAKQVMDSMASSSNDYAAALCVKAYKVCERIHESADEAEAILSKIEQITNLPRKDSMGLRWTVSLLFVKGKLLQATGRLEMAKEAFVKCSKIDVREFGIHLATKTTEALYLAGRIAYSLGDREEARMHWRSGIEYGKMLLNVSLDDVLINPDFPNRFNHGDGVREYTVAWDNIARCANGIHLLNVDEYLDFSALDNCHQTEYTSVTNELIAARQTLAETTSLL
ncbi:MAG: methyltransferase domain-containing protein, partial [Gammaproteobacteria bacterium]